jgi:lipopolysaccharide export system permease protein
MVFIRNPSSRLHLILALATLGAVCCALLLPGETRAVHEQLVNFPDSDVPSHQARPMVLAALCFLPALAGLIYSLGSTLDRYIIRLFLGIFGICAATLFLIWLLINLSDKIGDFANSRHILRSICTFYAIRTPAITVQLLPYTLLLSLLHTLGKLSTNREIIAIIQSGRGILRITLPLLVVGVFCTLFSLGLNYHWAPVAEGRRDDILAEASGKTATEATQVLYRNSENRRLWMIGSFPPDYQKGKALLNVEVTTTGENQRLQARLSASQARWNRNAHQWTFQNAVIGRYVPGHSPEFEKFEQPLTIDSWSETPWQLIKPGLSAAELGIPDLSGWLKAHAHHHAFADRNPYLTQWHYRWALPFTCIVTVLFATPLAIHFSRRSSGGGIFLAVLLSSLMLLVTNIVLAFGESGTLRPALAAWLPTLAFALLGIYLYHRRITSRPIYHSLRKLLPGGDDA